MHTKPPRKTSTTLIRILTSLDELRMHVVDLDALTNCARSSLEGLPHFQRPNRHSENRTARELAEDVEAYRKVGRLQSLIFAAAAASDRLMDVCDAVIERAEEEHDDEYSEPADADDDDDNGNGGGSSGGPAGNGQPGGPGSPGALTRGKGGTFSIPTPPAEPPIPPLA